MCRLHTIHRLHIKITLVGKLRLVGRMFRQRVVVLNVIHLQVAVVFNILFSAAIYTVSV